MGRGGIEPPTHGFSVHANKNTSQVNIRTYNSNNSVRNNFAMTLAKNVEQFPEIISVINVIVAWPGLSPAKRQRILKTIKTSVRGS